MRLIELLATRGTHTTAAPGSPAAQVPSGRRRVAWWLALGSVLLAGAVASWYASEGNLPPMPALEMQVRDGRLFARLVAGPNAARERMVVARVPFAEWSTVYDGADLGAWHDTGLVGTDDSALRVERISERETWRSRIEFTGARGRAQAESRVAEDLRIAIGGRGVTVRPFDGALLLVVSAEGTGCAFHYASGVALLDDAPLAGWSHSLDIRLVNVDPPCIRLPGNRLVALGTRGNAPNTASARMHERLPTGIQTISARRVRDDRCTTTTVEAPGIIATFHGADWGAGGELGPDVLHLQPPAIGGAMALEAVTGTASEQVACVYRQRGMPDLHVEDAGLCRDHLAMRRAGRVSWILRAHAAAAGVPGAVSIEGTAEGAAAPEICHRFIVDERGLVTRIEHAGGATTAVEYDVDGRVTTVTDPGGSRVTFAYDDDTRTRTLTGDGVSILYRFDSDGLCLVVARNGEDELTRILDADGRIVAEKTPHGTRTFLYLEGGLVRMSESSGEER